MRPSEALAKANKEDIVRIVEENTGRNPRVFGSAARGDDAEGSDLDLLIDRTARTSLLDKVAMRRELGELLGVKVDILISSGMMPRRLHERVMADLRPL